ncbi:Phosphoribosylglycinamide formyltransferase (GART) [Dionaea muscipula]
MEGRILLPEFTPIKYGRFSPLGDLKVSSFAPLSLFYVNAKRGGFVKSRHGLTLSSSKNAYFKMGPQCKREAAEEDASVGDLGGLETKPRRKNLAVFVSGGGSNFRAIHEATLDGSVHGDIVVLVTDKGGCGGAQYARDKGIRVILFPISKNEPDGLKSNDLIDTLRRCNVDFILLAGYLKLIPVELVKSYSRCIVNIHPSLLPAFGGQGFYGMKVHRAVIASGARYSGPTVHVVEEEYDKGKILAQRVVPVFASDSAEDLAARVLEEEHRLYVEVASALCEERIVWRDDGVPLIRSTEDRNAYN